RTRGDCGAGGCGLHREMQRVSHRMAPKRPSHSARIEINAEIGRVFAVLADPWAYADWVVGSDRIREADPEWPEVGSEFHHVVGVWPLKSHDYSYVEAVEAPRHL